MADEIAQNSTKSLVSTVHYQMFYLRFMGLTYEQIAEKTGYHQDRVRHIFAKGGVLYDLWQNWLKTAKENSLEEARDMMFGQLPDVVRTMIMTAKSPYTATGVSAGTKIMDYTLGKPPETVNVKGVIAHGSFAEWAKAQTLKEKEHERARLETLPAGADQIL
jgi:hypothetical protein